MRGMTAQDLKNSILQWAIQGKLVEQREEEGTAKELIEQIKAEKEQLIKEKKIKKEKPLPEITEEEMPFDIPESWVWVRLGEAFEVIMGQSPKGDSVFEGVGGLEFHQGKVFFGDDYLKESPQSTNKPTKIIEPDTVLLCVRAPVGNVNITERKICIGRGLCAINSLGGMSEKFVMFFLRAFKTEFIRKATGTTFVAITGEVVKNQVIPLPPLEEQKRIVAKIEELMPYVEQYDQAYTKLEVFNKKFPEDMQKSILQYAIQGKLVEQRAEEGTAEELYQQIQGEKERLIKEKKIKKEKPLPEITEDVIPFDIPDSWKWVRFGDVINLLSGQDFAPDKYNDQNEGIPYITGASSLSDEGVVVTRWTTEPRCIANIRDILLVCKGSGYGKTVMCDTQEAHIARQIMAIKYTECMIMKYLRYYLSANILLIKQSGQGVIPGIDRKSIQTMLFPLPPLEEQKRIVAKIEEMLPYCKQLIK